MRTHFSFCRLAALFFSLQAGSFAKAQTFPFVTKAAIATVVYAKETMTDSVVANLFADDVERITSRRPVVSSNVETARGNVILIGSVHSKLVQQFLRQQSSFYKNLNGKWECFGLKVLDKPNVRISKLLLVTGSDARGTAYGVFTLSQKLGVSPWWWWADVPVRHQKELVINQPDFFSLPPSVKYRGIFINDEDWGLRPWAATTFEPEKKNIGPKTYAKVFELLLRLKANLLWPAMHPGTEPFFNDPANLKLAATYSIVIGSSHAEPMLRNNVGEWNEKTMGDFNYVNNKEKIDRYWQDRIKQSAGTNAVYTVGMRGVHDSGIEGVKDAKEAVPLLERIIKDQRDLLRKELGKDEKTIPQAFTAYKEVLDIYDHGLKLPNDVTLVWPDDNYGYIQRLNNQEETKRSGGSGVYYHASYWGRPHDYLWLSTTHPSLICEEMMKAYENGASCLWVLNVGDIKPLEYNVQLFMDMAYNALPFKKSRYTQEHLHRWCEDVFGKPVAAPVENILWKYYNLAFARRPEFMGWSQTEPTTNTNYTAYNHFFYGDEAQRRINAYDSLQRDAVTLRNKIATNCTAAFYQVVYYPVVCAALMNKKFLYRDKAYLYGKQNRLSAFDYATLSKAVYDSIARETDYYNTALQNGKWKGMMSMKPRDLPVFGEPALPALKLTHDSKWCLAPEGNDTLQASALSTLNLPDFTSGCRQEYFVDVFLTDSVDVQWQAKPSVDWIVISAQSGALLPQRGKNQLRLWVKVDWSKVPKTEIAKGQILFSGGNKRYSVGLRALHPAAFANAKGFVETNGYVSMFAEHFSSVPNGSNTEWEIVNGLGHTGVSMRTKISPTKAEATLSGKTFIPQNAATLSYDFYNLTEVAPHVSVYTLPTHPLNKNFGMRYGLCVDEGPVQVVDFKTVGRSEEWKQNVLRNEAIKTLALPLLRSGKHTLKIYAIDPGIALDRILINFGQTEKAFGIVPETVRF